MLEDRQGKLARQLAQLVAVLGDQNDTGVVPERCRPAILGTPGVTAYPAGSYIHTVTIDHDSGVPVYTQLAEILRRQIDSGAIARRVPSIKSLSQEYGVSHVSTERALGVLKEEGLIHSAIGKRFFVTGR
jgi:Bacterial regulatory proteins, gntR family